MSRLSADFYFHAMANLVATRGTCARRKVGCVLVDKRNHVLATGYNGPPSGFPHCIDTPCTGAHQKSGEGLELCQAVHAEQNALLQCHDVYAIQTAYCTTAPCIHCIKLLLNTSCERVVFANDYPHSEASKALWEQAGRQWVHFDIDVDRLTRLTGVHKHLCPDWDGLAIDETCPEFAACTCGYQGGGLI